MGSNPGAFSSLREATTLKNTFYIKAPTKNGQRKWMESKGSNRLSLGQKASDLTAVALYFTLIDMSRIILLKDNHKYGGELGV